MQLFHVDQNKKMAQIDQIPFHVKSGDKYADGSDLGQREQVRPATLLCRSKLKMPHISDQSCIYGHFYFTVCNQNIWMEEANDMLVSAVLLFQYIH